MSRTRVGAGFFGGAGTKPGQTYGNVSRINLGSFGPGEDEKKARALYAANERRLEGETPNGLGRNIATANDVARQRETDTLTGQQQSRLIGGPAPDRAWDAFFGSLQRKEAAANDAGMKFNARPALRALGRPNDTSPAMTGLQTSLKSNALFGDPRAQQQADTRYDNWRADNYAADLAINPNKQRRRY